MIVTPDYTRHPKAYEILSSAAFVGRRRRLFTEVLRIADIRPDDRVLDLGCGTGYLTALAASAGARALGIDASEPMIAEARRLHPAARFRVERAESFVAPAGSFDVVVSSLLFQTLTADLSDAVAANALQLLGPGGRIVIVALHPPLPGHLAASPDQAAYALALAEFTRIHTRRIDPLVICTSARTGRDEAA
ncbi:methyltransferase family protein [Saccharothrix saharensis]|uniref:Methyltransferase family protein n=2 Tax=Saccharothrix saharensis TaxID=571190 RepID=A0A543J8U9_9PSEU|nr:methyltransferase family protein [Saccharothrix saharensis]